MASEEEAWIPAPHAVELVAARMASLRHRAIDRISGWFFDRRVRLRAAQALFYMPDEYLDEPYFDESDPRADERYQELYGHTHPESALKRRERADFEIDPRIMTPDCIEWGSAIWDDAELTLLFGHLNPEARMSFYGVMVNECELVRCMEFLPQKLPAKSPIEASSKKTAGRPAATWWPDFATELAIVIHDEGLPDTQAALISRIQESLTIQGKEEPSRAAIQPVIREIFSRLSQPGKARN